jgi:hypothetical protein
MYIWMCHRLHDSTCLKCKHLKSLETQITHVMAPWSISNAEAVVESDRESVFSRAGAISSGEAEKAMETSSATCMICMEDLTGPSQPLAMSCGHTFCKPCWLSHFQVLIREGRACAMPCMAFKCGAICDHPCALSPSDLLCLVSKLLCIFHCMAGSTHLHGKWFLRRCCLQKAFHWHMLSSAFHVGQM